MFVPPTSGKWIFFIRSDDSSRLFLNKSGADPAGKEMIAEETDCCDAFVEPGTMNDDGSTTATSEPISLTAGKQYYIEAIQKEGTGGDYIQVAGKLESDTTAPANLSPLSGSLFQALADPGGASVTITQQPVNITVVQRGPQGSATPLRNDNFNTSDGGYTVSGGTAPDQPWTWDSGAGAWACSSPGGSGPYATHLTSPTITVPSAGTVSVTFTHRYSMEDTSTYYDGGVVQLSVNGGNFVTVPPTGFTANGYVGYLVGTHELGNLAAFAGKSAGYDDSTLITSTAYLGTFNAGDKIALQFAAAWDANTMGTEPNWQIDSVKVELGAVAAPGWATFSVGAAATYHDAPSTFISYTWQRDNGSGFQNVASSAFYTPLNQATCLVPATLADNGAKFRCLIQGLSASVTSEVVTLTVTTNAVVDRPTLTAQREGANVTISWPASASSFVLQQTSLLPAASWTAVPSSQYKTTATGISVTVPATGAAFYRLSQ